jgi:phage terminase small subunit
MSEPLRVAGPVVKPRPPTHLSDASQAWFKRVVDGWELDEHHVLLLTLAAEAWDRGQGARGLLDEHGLTYVDRFGAPRTRPEVAIERDSRLAFDRLVRSLDLDESPLPPADRLALRSRRKR